MNEALVSTTIIRVLTVYDQRLIPHNLRVLLGQDPVIQVGEAVNGQEAVVLATQMKPVEAKLQRLLGRSERLPYANILMLSVYDQDELSEECLALGAESYILKDVNDREFLRITEWEKYSPVASRWAVTLQVKAHTALMT